MVSSDRPQGASGPSGDGLGYARAAGPVQAASAVQTSAQGLDARRVMLPAGDRDIPAYVARPEAAERPPVMLVLSEAFGLHEHIADIARRCAHAGFLAVAPDLMVRQGNPAAFADMPTLVADLLLRIPDAQVMGDLDACVAWAADQGGDTDRLSAAGFCWGGRWTWLFAAHRPFCAAVAWYGVLDGSAHSLFPKGDPNFPAHPSELTGDMRTPTLGLYGGADEAIPVATVGSDAAAPGHGEPGRPRLGDRGLRGGAARLLRRLPVLLRAGTGDGWLGAEPGLGHVAPLSGAATAATMLRNQTCAGSCWLRGRQKALSRNGASSKGGGKASSSPPKRWSSRPGRVHTQSVAASTIGAKA